MSEENVGIDGRMSRRELGGLAARCSAVPFAVRIVKIVSALGAVGAVGASQIGCAQPRRTRVIEIPRREFKPFQNISPDNRYAVMWDNGGVKYVDLRANQCQELVGYVHHSFTPEGGSAIVESLDGMGLADYRLADRSMTPIAESDSKTWVRDFSPVGRFLILNRRGDYMQDGVEFEAQKVSAYDRSRQRSTELVIEGSRVVQGDKKNTFLGDIVFNPADNGLAYTVFDSEHGSSQIFALDANSAGLVRQLTLDGNNQDVHFVTDDHVVYSSNNEGRGMFAQDLLRADIRTGEEQNLTARLGGVSFILGVNPDLAEVVFMNHQDGGANAVVKLNVLTGQQTQYIEFGDDCVIVEK